MVLNPNHSVSGDEQSGTPSNCLAVGGSSPRQSVPGLKTARRVLNVLMIVIVVERRMQVYDKLLIPTPAQCQLCRPTVCPQCRALLPPPSPARPSKEKLGL